MNGQRGNEKNLFGEGLAVIPGAVEDDVAVSVDDVARGDHTVDMDGPTQAPSDVRDFDGVDLQGIEGLGVAPWSLCVRVAHGLNVGCTYRHTHTHIFCDQILFATSNLT